MLFKCPNCLFLSRDFSAWSTFSTRYKSGITFFSFAGVSETEFLTYKGTYRDDHSGKLDTEAGPVNVSLEGLGASKLESCFGKLKKEELDVKKLLKDSESRFWPVFSVLFILRRVQREEGRKVSGCKTE